MKKGTLMLKPVNMTRNCELVHIQQVSGTPMTSKFNKHDIRFPRDEEGTIDVKSGKYNTNNEPKKATFNY